MINTTSQEEPATPCTCPNPETKAQFAKKVVINFLKEVTKTSEVQKAAETARVQAMNSAESDINLT